MAELPDAVTREVLAGMDKQDREPVEAVLSYAEVTDVVDYLSFLGLAPVVLL